MISDPRNTDSCPHGMPWDRRCSFCEEGTSPEITDAMYEAYRNAIKELIDSVPPEERAKRWKQDDKGWRIPERDKAQARWGAMMRAEARGGPATTPADAAPEDESDFAAPNDAHKAGADLLDSLRGPTEPTSMTSCEHCDGEPGSVKTYANQACIPINGRVYGIDWCIHQIVAALNAGGVETRASCCGHGKQPGRISLADGRDLTIMQRTTP